MQEALRKHAAKIAAAAQERSKKKAVLRQKVANAKDWSEEEVRNPSQFFDFEPHCSLGLHSCHRDVQSHLITAISLFQPKHKFQ
jgi:hypothetical protein